MTIKRPTANIVITGNHHTPAIELITQLQNDHQYQWHVFYISQLNQNETHLQKTIIPLLGNRYLDIRGGKYDRNSLLKTILGIPKTITAFFRSLLFLKRVKPDIVVSFGGYISFPVIAAAAFLKIPSLTHEQTLTVSLSTLLNSLFCKYIALSFAPSQNKIPRFLSKKSVVTGNLLRSAIFSTQSTTLSKTSPKKPVILFLGGNQGSTAINNTILSIIPSLTKKFFVIHQTGPQSFSVFRKLSATNYLPLDYIDQNNIGWAFHQANIVVSRSGANTCQELDALDKKAILIPLPFSQQNEQLLNAQWLKRLHPKTIVIIPQLSLTPKLLTAEINQLLAVHHQPQTTPPSQNHKLLRLIHRLIQHAPKVY